MTDEERQRTIDFILQQQAQLTASAQRNEEEHAQFTEGLKQLNKSVGQLGRIAVGLARQYRHDRTDLRERISALVNAQMRSEEKQSRSGEWRARMEKSFARSDERMTRLEEEAERNSAAIAKLAASSDRNRDDIGALARVVSDLARARHGGEGPA